MGRKQWGTPRAAACALVLLCSLSACSGLAPPSRPDAPGVGAPPVSADIERLPWLIEAVTAPHTRQERFYSALASADVSFHVFLPPAYTQDTLSRFPVIYWLHGSGGGEGGIRPLVNHFGTAMEEGKIPPALVVFPNGLPLGMWSDSKDGRQPVEGMLIRELVPFVDREFRTIAERRGRVIEGFSMGGYGAGRLGLKYHELFGGIGMWAPGPMQLDFSRVAPQNEERQPVVFRDVYGNDMGYFMEQSPWRLAEAHGHRLPASTPIRIIVGNTDYVYPATADFHRHLDSLLVPHTWLEFEDIGHSMPRLLAAVGDRNWSFYSAVFR